MKHTLLCLSLLIVSLSCEAQIRLNGYKCKFYEGQWLFTMAEMCSKTDTFRFTLYSRDIWSELPDGETDPKKELEIGLKLCFDDSHYYKTKDNLYINTGKNDFDVYYYVVYVPDKQASVSVRSKNNDSAFSAKSRWLLSQIRSHKNKDIFLENEKGQSCQNPDDIRH